MSVQDRDFPDISPELVEQLKAELGPDYFLLPGKIAERYHSDWAFDHPLCPAGLMLPIDSGQVSRILKLCNDANQPIVVQGGLTGLASGATPRPKEISLSLERLNGVEKIDKNGLCMHVKAGTTLANIHKALEGTGLTYGVDYGARQLCHIGGNVSTNAGGTQVIHYGMTRAQVLGLEAVLADGTVISSMNQLLKNNAGYDLKQLFIGTEGTLGVVTDLVLKLQPETTSRCTGLFITSSYQDILILLNLCRSTFGESLHAVEVMWRDYYEYAAKEIESSLLSEQSEEKQKGEFYALIEIRGRDSERDQGVFQTLFEQCLEQEVIIDGAIAETAQDAEDIWAVRYAVKSLLKTMNALANFDIGISINEMDRFVQKVKTELNARFKDIDTLFFGHIGDGNLHILASTGSEKDVEAIYTIVYPICAEFKGTISAEHGIGVQKKAKLGLSRTDAEIELMKTLKRAMDPNNILNPGRIFDL